MPLYSLCTEYATVQSSLVYKNTHDLSLCSSIGVENCGVQRYVKDWTYILTANWSFCCDISERLLRGIEYSLPTYLPLAFSNNPAVMLKENCRPLHYFIPHCKTLCDLQDLEITPEFATWNVFISLNCLSGAIKTCKTFGLESLIFFYFSLYMQSLSGQFCHQ